MVLLSLIAASVRRLFRPRTVAGCISGFQRTLEHLEEVEIEQAALAAEKRSKAYDLMQQASDHDAEGDRALVIARRINQIVGA